MSWQTTIVQLPEKLEYIMNSGEFSDVTLVVGKGDEGKSFHVHRVIYAMHSEVMSALFYGPMKDANEEIHLPEDDPSSFEIMTRMIYCQPTRFTSVQQAIGVYYLVDKYMIHPLKIECIEYLLENLSPETALEIYQMAISAEEHHLQKQSWIYIARNATNVLASESFTEINVSVMSRIASSTLLTISSELEIYKALCSWGKRECERKDQSHTAENVRSNTNQCLSKVRFLTFTVDEFMTGLGDLDVLTKEEQLSILKNLIKPGVVDLPPVCCSRRENRSPFPDDKEYFNCDRKGIRSFSPISTFPNFTEHLQSKYNAYIYGVNVYLSLKDYELRCPTTINCTLSIRNISKQTETTTTFSEISDHTCDGSRLIVEQPIYVGKDETCEITLKGTWNTIDSLYYCSGDCYKSIYNFGLLNGDLEHHFHGIYMLEL